ncbi:hypothetical protein BUE80_DR009088 [Diplocarpon rosae]|nr:hypothetical protein BUE80_DR009088 [Diplocarpon rosae]
MKISTIMILAQAFATHAQLEKHCMSDVFQLTDGHYCRSGTPYCCQNPKTNYFSNPKTCSTVADKYGDNDYPDCSLGGTAYCVSG